MIGLIFSDITFPVGFCSGSWRSLYILHNSGKLSEMASL